MYELYARRRRHGENAMLDRLTGGTLVVVKTECSFVIIYYNDIIMIFVYIIVVTDYVSVGEGSR